MQSGELWERTTPVLRIAANAFGSLLIPTPTVMDTVTDRMNGGAVIYTDKTGKPRRRMPDGKSASMGLARLVVHTPSGNWPTPTCADAFTDKLKSSQQQEGSMHSVNLSQAVKMWPTPLKSDYNQRRKSDNWAGSDLPSMVTEVEELSGNIQPKSGGSLNPTWVEWLMGWPLAWTDLRPSGTDKFHKWPHSHGIPYTNGLSTDEKG
jgi:hypothetical protein